VESVVKVSVDTVVVAIDITATMSINCVRSGKSRSRIENFMGRYRPNWGFLECQCSGVIALDCGRAIARQLRCEPRAPLRLR
jgi:hypothetical protein